MNSSDIVFVKSCNIPNDLINIINKFSEKSDKVTWAVITVICVILMHFHNYMPKRMYSNNDMEDSSFERKTFQLYYYDAIIYRPPPWIVANAYFYLPDAE